MTGQEKFDSCVHRSDEPEISAIISRCCSSKDVVTKSWTCWALSIDNVTPEICEKCVHYREKQEENG